MKAPDVAGIAGRAWRATITPEERARKPHGLDAYVVHQPGVNVAWSWWLITGCDLFHDPDSKTWGKLPPKRNFDGATHEFICFALNPDRFHGGTPPDGWDAGGDDPARVFANILTPQEFVHQEALRDNDQANEIMRLFVRSVCDGLTAADSDFRSRNIALIAGTAEHFRQGRHEVH